MNGYNPWHGCHKYSEGCLNCYIYSMDKQFDRDTTVVKKTKSYDLIIKTDRNGMYRFKPDYTDVYTCLSSDFFIEEADKWRLDVWSMIKKRNDLNFLIITKRINRFYQCLPNDWQDGYDNVTIIVTIENQKCLEKRLPLFNELPIKHKQLNCEPLLETLDFKDYLKKGAITKVTVGGESGINARPCDFNLVKAIRQQCISAQVAFSFKQTGANFIKDGKQYKITKKDQHIQAKKSNIDYQPEVNHEKK